MQKFISRIFLVTIICLSYVSNSIALEMAQREEIARTSVNIINQDPLEETIPFCLGMSLKAMNCYGEEKESIEKIISFEISGYNWIYGNSNNFQQNYTDGVVAGLAISDECRDTDTLSRFIAEYCSLVLKPFNEKIKEIIQNNKQRVNQ